MFRAVDRAAERGTCGAACTGHSQVRLRVPENDPQQPSAEAEKKTDAIDNDEEAQKEAAKSTTAKAGELHPTVCRMNCL